MTRPAASSDYGAWQRTQAEAGDPVARSLLGLALTDEQARELREMERRGELGLDGLRGLAAREAMQ